MCLFSRIGHLKKIMLNGRGFWCGSDEKMMRMWFGLEIDVVGLPPFSGHPIKVETEPAHKVGHVHTNMNKYTVNLEFRCSPHSIPVVNLNSNRTCPVCTGLPDNSVYWPDPMVQYVALTRLTYDRGQFSWHSPKRGLTMTTPMVHSDFLLNPA